MFNSCIVSGSHFFCEELFLDAETNKYVTMLRKKIFALSDFSFSFNYSYNVSNPIHLNFDIKWDLYAQNQVSNYVSRFT